jgi:predicted XRE-type DNA-binding protein
LESQDLRKVVIMSKVEDRFWSKVSKTDTCWEWTAFKEPHNGYGRFAVDQDKRRGYLAHRYSFELNFNVHLASDLQVLHTCDNPACVNPDHLFLGHTAANAKDKAVKGRGRNKLTNEQVIQLRMLGQQGKTQTEIASILGINQSQVSRILNRERRFHI